MEQNILSKVTELNVTRRFTTLVCFTMLATCLLHMIHAIVDTV